MPTLAEFNICWFLKMSAMCAESKREISECQAFLKMLRVGCAEVSWFPTETNRRCGRLSTVFFPQFLPEKRPTPLSTMMKCLRPVSRIRTIPSLTASARNAPQTPTTSLQFGAYSDLEPTIEQYGSPLQMDEPHLNQALWR